MSEKGCIVCFNKSNKSFDLIACDDIDKDDQIFCSYFYGNTNNTDINTNTIVTINTNVNTNTNTNTTTNTNNDDDDDVINEEMRVLEGRASGDVVVLNKLRKV